MSNKIPQYDTKLFTEVWDEANKFLTDYTTAGIPATISRANATTLYYLLYARYGNTPIANYDENQFKYKVFSIIFQYGPTWEKRLSVQETLRGMQLSDLIDNGGISELYASNEESAGNTAFSNETSNTSTGGTTSTGTVKVKTDNKIEDIKNHAFNPSTAPSTNAYAPLNYVNEQNANKNVVDGEQLTTNNLAGSSNSSGSGTEEGTGNSSGTRDLNSTRNTTMSAGKLKAYEKLLELLKSDVTGEFISKFKVCFKQFVMPERHLLYITDEEEGDED